jgi:hypothetical protein
MGYDVLGFKDRVRGRLASYHRKQVVLWWACVVVGRSFRNANHGISVVAPALAI